jgi:HEAT repeat protein
MVRNLLDDLAADVGRQLASGIAAITEGEALRRRATELREAGQQLPSLLPLAELVDQALVSAPDNAARALLDLDDAVRQMKASLPASDGGGDLEPIAPSGPWATQTPADVAYDLLERLTRSREAYDQIDERGEVILADLEALENAARAGLTADIRLLDAALDKAQGYKRIPEMSANGRSRVELVVESILPSFGPAILAELLEGYDPTASWHAAGRLAAICRIDPGLGHRLCLESLPAADRYLQEVILDSLHRIAPDEVESVALRMLEQGFGRLGPHFQPGPHVVRALRRLGPLSETAIGRLIQALSHANPSVRGTAASVLKGLGPRARAAVPVLHAMLKTPGEQFGSALEALKVLDPKGEADVPELVAGLADGESFYRFAMARWLRSLGPQAHVAVPALIAALRDEHDLVRSEAAACLGAIGAAARSAIPALAAALEDQGVGQSPADALLQIARADDTAFAALINALDHSNHEVPCRIIEALKKCDDVFDRAVPALVAKIDDLEIRVRYATLGALLEHPLPAPYALRVCRAAQKEDNPYFQRAAAKLLARFSPEGRSQVRDDSPNRD